MRHHPRSAGERSRRGGAHPRRPGRDLTITFTQFVSTWNGSQGRDTPALHLEIAQWLHDGWLGGDKSLLLLVFRDAGKSTLVGLFCAWLLVREPGLRILVLSAE
jgi:hypothetical protein